MENSPRSDHNTIRSVLTALVFIIILSLLFILNLVVPSKPFLNSERRAPTRMPVLSMSSLKTDDFSDDFEDFIADGFPFRDEFRAVHSLFLLGVLRFSDKDGLYIDSEGLGEYKKTDAASIIKAAQVINKVALNLDGLNIYYSFIPDKSIYSNRQLPGFDAAMVTRLLSGSPGMDDYNYIDLTDTLESDSFYKTDFHWDQTKLNGVMTALGENMNFNYYSSQYEQEFAGDFQGTYSGQFVFPDFRDYLLFLTNPILSAKKMNSLTKEIESTPIYDLERFNGVDPYDIFLSGAQPLVILENESIENGRTLYVFRDSFSSSLAPLLAGAYSTVTLIDLRYIDLRTLERYVEFKPGSDVLFIYSSIVLNNPEGLLVY